MPCGMRAVANTDATCSRDFLPPGAVKTSENSCGIRTCVSMFFLFLILLRQKYDRTNKLSQLGNSSWDFCCVFRNSISFAVRNVYKKTIKFMFLWLFLFLCGLNLDAPFAGNMFFFSFLKHFVVNFPLFVDNSLD